MSHYQALKHSCLGIAVLSLLLAGFHGLSFGIDGCHPASPNPCAADGVCRPKRDSWGHYKTKWRSWPGEKTGQEPTLADEAAEQEGGPEQLPPFDLPKPEDEGIRGPVREKAAKSAQEETAEQPDEQPDGFLPGPGEDPGFDPQGNQLEIPSLEDTPPALPQSLRQAALSRSAPTFTTATFSTPTHESTPQVQSSPTNVLTSPVQQPVRQTTWQQPAIGLINPAAAIVTEPEANQLQQAIYYEASDLDETE